MFPLELRLPLLERDHGDLTLLLLAGRRGRRRRCSLSARHFRHLAFDSRPGSYPDAREGVSNCIRSKRYIALVDVYADSWSAPAAVPGG